MLQRRQRPLAFCNEVEKAEDTCRGWQEVDQQWQKDWRAAVGNDTWKVKDPVLRKHQHPTSVPDREALEKIVEGFRVLSGNALILNQDGHTLCAVFGGQGFRLSSAKATAVLQRMQEWKEDPTARVPYSGPRKRSYDETNYVSD